MTFKCNLGAAAFGLAVLAGPALAEFPERNIESIYPWAPGATMAASQVIADAMGSELGVNVSVVSTPGAGGVKAFETALSRNADGYTLIDGYVAPLVIQPMQGNASWTYEDFTPLSSATSNSFAIAVRADDDRFATLTDLIDFMRDNPGNLRYSPGVAGGIPHMAGAATLMATDTIAQLVPYPEIDVAVRDMRGGIVDFIITNPGVYNVNKDSMKVLAVLSELPEAAATYDDAPLVGEFGIDLGMPALSPSGWNWWLVHKDTPEDVVATLRSAMDAALQREDVQQRLLDMGYVPTGFSPDEYQEIVGSVVEGIEHGQDAIAWETERLNGL